MAPPPPRPHPTGPHQVAIPSDAELDILTREIDRDENGLIDYTECTDLVRTLGVVRTADVAVMGSSLRATLRSYRRERKSLVLWRDLFDQADHFPRDGQISACEMGRAFEQMVVAGGGTGAGLQGGGFGIEERIATLMRRVDLDRGTMGGGQISFDEFKAKATDMVLWAWPWP